MVKKCDLCEVAIAPGGKQEEDGFGRRRAVCGYKFKCERCCFIRLWVMDVSLGLVSLFMCAMGGNAN